MPMPHPHLNIPSSNRRTTVSARQRENHPQNSQVPVVAASSRRRKSRSPETRAKRPATIAGPSHLASSHSLVIRPLQDEAAERGRNRAKPRARPHPVRVEGDDATLATNVLHDTDRAPGASSARSKRKERSRSREVASRLSRKAVMAPDVMEEEDKPIYTGPLAQADYHRMKQEVEDLRKQVAMSKKTINKQSKVRLPISFSRDVV
ncbi:hypothetical protein C2E23DRAFT_384722 [Lenzites betulinus]|nr:hypothetical protein C2E23DRAFT_384722 [Lenzites betulinus]